MSSSTVLWNSCGAVVLLGWTCWLRWRPGRSSGPLGPSSRCHSLPRWRQRRARCSLHVRALVAHGLHGGDNGCGHCIASTSRGSLLTGPTLIEDGCMTMNIHELFGAHDLNHKELISRRLSDSAWGRPHSTGASGIRDVHLPFIARYVSIVLNAIPVDCLSACHSRGIHVFTTL